MFKHQYKSIICLITRTAALNCWLFSNLKSLQNLNSASIYIWTWANNTYKFQKLFKNFSNNPVSSLAITYSILALAIISIFLWRVCYLNTI